MSIHTTKARILAAQKGGAAGRDQNTWLWDLPKRELIEALLHLAAMCTDSYDDALAGDGATVRVREELTALKANGII
jgi:hypothetical protein